MSNEQPNQLQMLTLDDSCAQSPAARNFILPGFIPEGANIFVRIGEGVDALEFATQMAYCCSGGLNFQPFGKPAPAVTAAFFRPHHGRRVHEHFQMFAEKQQSEACRENARNNLHYYVKELGGNPPLTLSMSMGHAVTVFEEKGGACQCHYLEG